MLKNKMKMYIAVGIGVVVLAVVLGFLLRSGMETDSGQGTDGEILYYTCGMHPSVKISPEEYKKGSVNCPICNMKLVPVYKEEKVMEKEKGKKVLFYRHPMNPSITSSEPAKDEMGMDYIPVYEEVETDDNYYGCGMEGEEHVFSIKGIKGMKCPICGMPLIKLTKAEADKLRGVASRVKVRGEQASLAGVRTEPAKKMHLFKEIRTVGRIAYDPDLAVAEDEYVSALRALGKIGRGSIAEIRRRARMLADSAEKKLRLLGLSDDQIEELNKTRKVHTSLILPEEKMWVYGDVYEYELDWLKIGHKVKITARAFQGEEFEGTISSINPVVDPKTRSIKFRAEVDNPALKLKPDMYVDVAVKSMYVSPDGQEEVLAIPKDSVLDTGVRKIVWFDKGDGSYEGRVVITGPEATAVIDGVAAKFFPVLSGIREGELVVTKANFLIDSQSQISGVAAAAYGGALGVEEKGADDKEDEDKKAPPVHQH